MLTKELEKCFISIDGKVFEPLNDIDEISIETSSLDRTKSYNFDGNKEFEAKYEIDKKEAGRLYDELQSKHGEKLTVETSCVCDGTFVFAIQLMQSLAKIGATNIKIRSEEVENPNPAWMKTRFIATGIVWNTNNFRKFHGVPMKRRNHGKIKT